jgi:hypothetical protein
MKSDQWSTSKKWLYGIWKETFSEQRGKNSTVHNFGVTWFTNFAKATYKEMEYKDNFIDIKKNFSYSFNWKKNAQQMPVIIRRIIKPWSLFFLRTTKISHCRV